MAANSQIFTGLALTLLPSASLQQASALKAPFLNSGAGLGTLKVKYVSVATSNQSQGGGRHRGLSVRVNLFDGFARVIESYGNAVVSFFEDPEDVLEEAVLEMDNDLTQMRQETARVLTSQKRLQDKYTAAQTASEEWYRKAQLALRKGAEDLSRDALERRKYYADNASHFKAQLDQQNSVVENLNINTKLLESKIQEAESKKDTLKARAQSAKTATEASDMMGNVKSLLTMSVYNLLSILMPMEWTEAPDDPEVERIKFTRHEISFVDVDDDLPNSKKEVAIKHVLITSSPINEVEGAYMCTQYVQLTLLDA